MNPVEHDFQESLNKSHVAENLPIWKEIYEKAFPGNKGFFNSRADGQLQRCGIDRTVILATGKSIYLDEKVRYEAYDDIFLEFISNDVTNTPGWVEKPLMCDFIAYAIIPLKKCFILPVPQLQSVWKEKKAEWLTLYGKKPVQNKSYKTWGCPVPTDKLFHAIGQSLRIIFA